MKPEFITFRKFDDAALVNELTELLHTHHIKYYIEEESISPNPLFNINNELSKGYVVKIQNNDFEQVAQILAENDSQVVADIGKDYYLFDFIDDELIDLLAKADEWSTFDQTLARKILSERGKSVSDEDLVNLQKERIAELKKPDKNETIWVFIGYISGFVGGVLGFFIGWHLLTYKKTLPNGERVLGYGENDRRHGKRILYISIVCFVMLITYKIMIAYNSIS
jgi:hypothetical protein